MTKRWVFGAIGIAIAYTCGYFVGLHLTEYGWVVGVVGMGIAGFVSGMGSS